MRLILITGVILLLLSSQLQLVQAVPAAPSPFCTLKANVVEVEKTRTNFSKDYVPEREDFEYYKVTLQIYNISAETESNMAECYDKYGELTDASGFILPNDEYDAVGYINKGDVINAIVHFAGDEYFGGNFLSDIKIIYRYTGPIPEQEKNDFPLWILIIVTIIILGSAGYIMYKTKNKN